MRKLTILFLALTLSVEMWAQENAEQNTLPTRTITWLVNNSSVKSESKELGVKLNTLTMPSTSENEDLLCADKFIGWSRENLGAALGQEAPTDLFTDITKFPDSEVVGSSDITFYAVFASAGGAGASSSITSFATGDYLLIDTYGDKYYAMSSYGTVVSSVDITSAVTKNADGTISVNASESVITEDLFYTVGGTASAATIYNIEDGKYVQGGTSTSFTQSTDNTWTVTVDDGRFTFKCDNRCILYRDGYDFRNYGTDNQGSSGYGTGYLYLAPAAGYEDYVTSCGKSLSISPKSLTAERPNSGTGTLLATANLYTPTGYTWTSDNEAVATVSGTGATATVTYHASGSCTITCSAPDGSNPMTATATVTVLASAPTPISTMYIDENGVEQTADSVNIVTNAASIVTWGQAGQTTWYVVTGTDVQLTEGAICNGNVNLILADGVKLTSTGVLAGIQVSGEGNSLTIYAQSDDITMGQLIANGGANAAGIGGGSGGDGSNITINGGTVTATGGNNAAGIGGGYGGGYGGSGSNITINGGRVTANGGMNGAGIGGGTGGSGENITINGGIITANGGISAAGIGGGDLGSGSNITINGGSVTANGGHVEVAGIGGGYGGSGSNIFICVTCRLRSGGFIHHDGTDIADLLASKRYVSVCTDAYLDERTAAYAAINALIEGIADEYIQTVGATAIEDIFQEDDKPSMEAIKTKALADLQKLIGTYNSGKSVGKEEAFGSLGTKQNGPAVIVTDQDDKQIILYSPKKVQYIKVSDK